METYNVEISWDDEAKVWLANCDEIPLAMEDGSLDKLIYRVKIAAPELIELNNLPRYETLVISLKQREKLVYDND